MSRATLRAVTGGAALAVGLLGSSGAWAQCTDNFNFVAVNVPSPGKLAPVQDLLPLGRGSSVSALISSINTVNTAFLTTTSAFVSAPGNPQPDQQGGGAWGRAIAGTVDTTTSSVGVLDGIITATGRQTCNTTTRQDYAGYQVGHDISILNGGGSGANWHFGVTAGYFEAKTKDITPAGSYTNPNFPAGFIPGFNGVFATPAGSFNATTEVPFVGIYTAFTKGGLFLDGQARWDFFQNTLTDANNGLSGQQLDARGFSLTGNAGYNVPLGGGWFIEPSGGVVWSRVQVDPLNVAGVFQTAAPFSPYARGSVTIEEIESILGRATLRVGTNFTSGGVAWQPFFTASVFHEFADDVVSRSLEAGTGTGLDGLLLTTTTSRVGTYGQFALGTAAAILNTGWLGYARADYRIGENIDGWSVNAGLRYQFTPERRGSIKDDPSTTARDTYNWTGFYVGGSAGTLWGHEQWVFTNAAGQHFNPSTEVKPDYAGYLLGGQAGYNVQVGKIVFGIEGDYGWSRSHGGVSCPNQFFFTCGAEVDQLGSLTGRVGYAWGRALLYGKAGWATAEVTPKASKNIVSPLVPLANPIVSSARLDGYTYGAGMEFALTNHVSAKAEWMHYELGTENFRVSDFPDFADVSASGNAVRIGINFHFNRMREEGPLK